MTLLNIHQIPINRLLPHSTLIPLPLLPLYSPPSRAHTNYTSNLLFYLRATPTKLSSCCRVHNQSARQSRCSKCFTTSKKPSRKRLSLKYKLRHGNNSFKMIVLRRKNGSMANLWHNAVSKTKKYASKQYNGWSNNNVCPFNYVL